MANRNDGKSETPEKKRTERKKRKKKKTGKKTDGKKMAKKMAKKQYSMLRCTIIATLVR